MKKTLFVILSIFLCGICFAQNENVQDSENSLEDEISNLTSQLEQNLSNASKIQIYKKIAKLQEFSNMFPEAEEAYLNCSQIALSNTDKTAFTLEAVRCALSYGNTGKADELLAKVANACRSNEFTPNFKLYAVWSWLSKCTNYDQTFEPIAVLKSYLELGSMDCVREKVLFTIWYVTGQIQYAKMLYQEFPQSAEFAIVSGNAELMPSPFWFFVSRKNPDKAELAKFLNSVGVAEKPLISEKPTDVAKTEKAKSADVSKTQNVKSESSKENFADEGKIKYYQLGFFSSKENALSLVNRAKKAGVNAEILEETRPSGNKYFVVIVNSQDEKMGTVIKNSGFECYPVF